MRAENCLCRRDNLPLDLGRRGADRQGLCGPGADLAAGVDDGHLD